MRLAELRVTNFRAVALFEATDLSDLIVIAGPNGCGKSCILDSIRLLKSAYGGYQFNEWLQWFGEFQINPNDPVTFRSLFRDPGRPLSIYAKIELSPTETAYLHAHAEAVLEPLVWAELTNQPADNFQFSSVGFAGQFPHLIAAVAAATAQRAVELRAELAQPEHVLSLTIPPGAGISILPSAVARAIFQTYNPQNLGIIDSIVPRGLTRERVSGGVNLDARAIETQRRTQSLYNWQAKYQNIKSELVTTYLRDIIARESGSELNAGVDLNETLKELFSTFFTDKEYLGVQPDQNGGISFPVRLSTGETHDLNDLSSGEKEVLYGYLRLRNSTPKNSTILIDEPELHLNPSLLRGFPDFYSRHVAQALSNQVWLVTHSDTLLRQAVGNPSYSVFHMTPATNVVAGSNQAVPVREDELQRAIFDLVGDAAAYRPYAKVLIFEGDGNGRFDVSVVSRLFPNLNDRATLISGESKGRVNDLYGVLSRTAAQVGLADRFYAVTDRDFDPPAEVQENTHVLSWTVYHIENYLLSGPHLLQAMRRVHPDNPLTDVDSIVRALKQVAITDIDALVVRELRRLVNARIVGSISIGGDPATEPITSILPSIQASMTRVRTAETEVASEEWLRRQADEYREKLQQTLDNGTWLEHFPGRPVLDGFVKTHLRNKVSYEGFVNLVIDAMVESEFRPAGMTEILEQIVPSP